MVRPLGMLQLNETFRRSGSIFKTKIPKQISKRPRYKKLYHAKVKILFTISEK